MIRYVVARQFPSGLCYMVVGNLLFIPPSWVPEIQLASRFNTRQLAELAAAIIPGAMVEEIEVEYDDDDTIDDDDD